MTSSISLALRRRGESTLYLPPMGPPNGESPVSRYHAAPSRNEVAVVQPVLVCTFVFWASIDIYASWLMTRSNTLKVTYSQTSYFLLVVSLRQTKQAMSSSGSDHWLIHLVTIYIMVFTGRVLLRMCATGILRSFFSCWLMERNWTIILFVIYRSYLPFMFALC